MTETLISLTNDPNLCKFDSPHVAIVEKAIVHMYDPSFHSSSLNLARKHMFSSHTMKPIELCPPTKNAFFMQLKRAVLAANLWSQAGMKHPVSLDPKENGWKWINNKWIPVWSDLPDVSKECRMLVSCACFKSCTGNCKCHKEELHFMCENYLPILTSI